MNKFILVFIVMMIGSVCFGQTRDSLYYDQQAWKYSLILRGKVLGGGVLEDFSSMNLTAGVEQRFMNYHSFGIDYVYVRHVSEYESYDSILGYPADNGIADYLKRQYLLFDYRFYFNFASKPRLVIPYINLYTKQGAESMWQQENSRFKRIEPLFYRTWFSEYGAMIGSHISFGNKRIGLDIALGANRYNSTIFFSDPAYDATINEFGLDIDRPWRMFMRFNLFYHLWSKKKPSN